MQNLKPCPFCGSVKLKLESKSVLAGYTGLDERVEQITYSVRCNVCHARGGTVGGKVLTSLAQIRKRPHWATTETELEDYAIAAWNRRANDEQTDC
jgi:Lar family restriction alleviation protein